ncbi:MAG: Mut7-C RNAse domain-containing protein [Proteobacteria bacterium]|nr:Mut7-C RNAse domain-containing protein [Pseudomonadota bacterium]
MVKPIRMLGFDIDFNPSYTTKDIIRISKQENRIILTTRKELLKSKPVTHGILMRPGTTIEQIGYVIDYLDVKDRIKPFSRCLRCNGLLKSEFTAKTLNRISPVTKSGCAKYILCKFCDENSEL